MAALAAMRQKITDNRDNPTLDVLRVQLDNASKQATGDAGSGFGGEQRKASAQRGSCGFRSASASWRPTRWTR